MGTGAVTIGFGQNDFYGGENSSDFSYDMFLPPGATVEIDGKVLVEKWGVEAINVRLGEQLDGLLNLPQPSNLREICFIAKAILRPG